MPSLSEALKESEYFGTFGKVAINNDPEYFRLEDPNAIVCDICILLEDALRAQSEMTAGWGWQDTSVQAQGCPQVRGQKPRTGTGAASGHL